VIHKPGDVHGITIFEELNLVGQITDASEERDRKKFLHPFTAHFSDEIGVAIRLINICS